MVSCQSDNTGGIPDQTGKVAIVTGGNNGLGKESVRQLALHGAKVYMASRTESRAIECIDELERDHPELHGKSRIIFLKLDLTSLESCQRAAKEFLEKEERLDILMNNAGIMAVPFELTKDGFDIQFQSNHLGHFAFTVPLLPLLIQTSKKSDASVRIVNLSSGAHNFATKEMTFDGIEAVNRAKCGPLELYGQSKLANILFTKELTRRLEGERIFVSAIDPGTVNTGLTRGVENGKWGLLFKLGKPLYRLMTKDASQGVKAQLYAATAREVEQNNLRGLYFSPDIKVTQPIPAAEDAQLALNLWDLSERIVRDKTGYESTF